MKVGVFYNSFRNPAKFPNKVMLMDNFRAGVLACGDEVVEYHNSELPNEPLAAGFVLGYTLENNFRKKIITSLEKQNTPRVFVDSNVLHYARPEHEWHRYSVNGVYPTSGVYLFGNLDPDKWNRYSTWHGVHAQPWRTTGKHVMIFCQRPHGWNMMGTDQEAWLDSIIAQIRTHSQRPIMVRMHPGDGTRFDAIQRLQKKYGRTISISQHASIREALVNCWCTVGYNSTPNVVANIEGVPGWVQDPDNSWAADVAFQDLAQLENPPLPDRSNWLNKIANIHWSNQEVKSGKLWSAIRQYISASR